MKKEWPNLLKADLKVGDEVIALGEVVRVVNIELHSEYPIIVNLDGVKYSFTCQGFHTDTSLCPTLWLMSDMSWLNPPTKPQVDHLKEFTTGREVWVSDDEETWSRFYAAIYLPSRTDSFGVYVSNTEQVIAKQDDAYGIAFWKYVSYTKPGGVE